MWRVVGSLVLSSCVSLGVVACSTPGPAPTSNATPQRETALREDPPAAAPTKPAAAPTKPAAVPIAEAPAAATGPRGTVMLVPFGKFPAAQVDAVAEHLRVHAQVEVVTQPAAPLPAEAWYAPRKRYRADRLLDHLEAMYADAPSTTHVLGLVLPDISTSKPPHEDWGIFGLGQMPGRAAVVSTFRLRKKVKNAAHLHRRLANTALHELGHTLGLDHCTEALCPMQDAEGSIANTDAANDDFGPGCLAALDRLAPRTVVDE